MKYEVHYINGWCLCLMNANGAISKVWSRHDSKREANEALRAILESENIW